ncbi:MAG: glutamine synthetase [Solirubrobacterales bacterium]|jgi:glutamine synthetase|nr:glutamine synthetase [Solirubrobacterales bacterium]
MGSVEVNHERPPAVDPQALDALARWPAEKLTREELVQLAASGEIEAVILATPDIQGKLFGKSMPAELFLAEGSMEFSSGTLVYDNDWDMLEGPNIGAANGWADMHMQTDWRSLRRLATFEKTAIVFADGAWASGESADELPRRLLSRQLARAAERGLGVVCAIETEFFVFAETYASARAKNFVNLDRLGESASDYSILHIGLIDPLIAEIRRTCIDSGVPLESIKHEWGKAQLELTLTYSDAMEAADRIALFKLITKQVCIKHGVAATFMARYSEEEGSSSGHVHSSLWELETGKSAMADEQDPTRLGKTGRNWLGGMMALAPDLMPFVCPSVNSFKRLDPETFAPTTNAWSLDVRTVPFRQVGRGPSLHVENRIPGADANFYLALAAVVGAGLYGMDHELEPIGEPITTAGFPGEKLPHTMPVALENLRSSKPAREIFGDAAVDHLVAMGENELAVYEKQVSDIERRRSFECA